MEIVVFTGRIVLVAVLLVSGIAKLFDREGSTEAMEAFGVPRSLRPLAVITLPIAELALAGMIVSSLVRWGALVTAVMLAVFAVAIARFVVQGQLVDCHCFGQLDSSPGSWVTVARNAGLTLIALMVWWISEPVPIWHGLTLTSFGIWLGTVAFLGTVMGATWAVLRLWENQQELLARIEALEASGGRSSKPVSHEQISFADVTAGIQIDSLNGTRLPVRDLQRLHTPLLLIFTSPVCRPCQVLSPDIAAWQHEFQDVLSIMVIGEGNVAENAARANEYGLVHMYVQDEDSLATALDVKRKPTAVLVDHDGYIRTPPMLAAPKIRNLIDGLRAQVAAVR